MNAKSDEPRAGDGPGRASARSEAAARAGRKRIGTRAGHFMVAAAGLTEEALTARLNDLGGGEILRTLPARAGAPALAVMRTTVEKAAALRQSARGALIVEPDEPLLPAALALASPTGSAPAVANALGAGFTTTIQVLNENEAPLAKAEVQLIGRQWTAQGVTGSDGRVALMLYGELPDTVEELRVAPRADYWGLRRAEPGLQADASHAVALRPLTEAAEQGWGTRVMRFDRLPSDWRGAGVKIALVDSGVATDHGRLSHIDRGFATRGDGDAWAQDAAGHGTACAGIIAAAPDGAHGVAGNAPEATLDACRLPPDARCSDLVAALDHCVAAGVDVACIGFGCRRGSTIVEQRLAAAKQRGIAIIAAAGSTGGAVQFPACSPHVLAVGAVGQACSYPDDSPHAAHETDGGLFVPAFSCMGPEVDFVAPGVAVIACQSPDGYVAADGTSLAAPHVAALAALVLAHHADFQRDFAAHDGGRVERLFQILKMTARPLGDPLRSGAGLPDAPRALGLEPLGWTTAAPAAVGLDAMRRALRLAGITGPGTMMMPEPPRGPAAIAALPLRMTPQPIGPAGVATAMRELDAAMMIAGLNERSATSIQ